MVYICLSNTLNDCGEHGGKMHFFWLELSLGFWCKGDQSNASSMRLEMLVAAVKACFVCSPKINRNFLSKAHSVHQRE